MKNIPSYMSPSNITNFQSLREERELVRMKRQLIEFMLTNDFIDNKNRCFELADNDGKILYESNLVDKCIEELKSLGWETKKWRTGLYIYPPNEVPKIFKYESLEV
jgi:hypothetical protein